jgi:hypothetical protein
MKHLTYDPFHPLHLHLEKYFVHNIKYFFDGTITKKERGILFTMCTTPLLDIHRLMYIPKTLTKIE